MRFARSLVAHARRASLLGALALLGATAAQAQGDIVDEGSFRVTIDGRTAGTEDFTIRQTGSGTNSELLATGHVRLTLPSGTLDLQPRLRATGLDATPVAYEVTIGGTSPRRIVGTLSGGRFSARTFSASGEQQREYVASSGAVVLDDNVAHQYYFLARRTRSGQIPVILPRENRQVMAQVTTRGEERVDVSGTPATLYHLVVTPAGGNARDVWVDALGRVIKVEIPAQRYAAIRTKLPR